MPYRKREASCPFDDLLAKNAADWWFWQITNPPAALLFLREWMKEEVHALPQEREQSSAQEKREVEGETNLSQSGSRPSRATPPGGQGA